MKTILVPLVGDPTLNLYQLGVKEREGFRKLEARVNSLVSASAVLRLGQDLVARARSMFKKKEESFFETCIAAYAEGLGVEPAHYLNFISLFELAAHYGQVYPELKALLPGCTTMLEKTPEGFVHNRLVDFPLIDVMTEAPRLYYWKLDGRPAVLSYACEGMAPLMLQVVHDGGFSLSLHHKPGTSYNKDGESIFKITFETLLESPNMNEFRRELRKKNSMTKWGYYLLEQTGAVICVDLDGPSMNTEAFNLNEVTPLIFTNIPLNKDSSGFENFIEFCRSRELWLKEKLKSKKSTHSLDLMSDVKDQKSRRWIHPSATLATSGAFSVNLSRGSVVVKEGSGALVASDALVEFDLASQSEGTLLKKAHTLDAFELAWKEASRAQSAFDQRDFDMAYHHLQMAQAQMPNPLWKEVFGFYLCVWDFKFVTNKQELSLIYRKLRKIDLPDALRDQGLFLRMRMEKRLGLVSTVDLAQVSPHLRSQYEREITASLPVFNAWMKLLYPRMEILDVFSPHHR